MVLEISFGILFGSSIGIVFGAVFAGEIYEPLLNRRFNLAIGATALLASSLVINQAVIQLPEPTPWACLIGFIVAGLTTRRFCL